MAQTDAHRFHGHRIAAERDRAGDADLQLAGYAVLRFSWRQVTGEPALVAARLAQALSARAPRRSS